MLFTRKSSLHIKNKYCLINMKTIKICCLMTKSPPIKKISFEDALKELEGIVKKLVQIKKIYLMLLIVLSEECS